MGFILIYTPEFLLISFERVIRLVKDYHYYQDSVRMINIVDQCQMGVTLLCVGLGKKSAFKSYTTKYRS